MPNLFSETNHMSAITLIERKRLNAMYQNMKGRCYNTLNISYDNIGGKGIRVDDIWLGSDGFKNYAAWCLEKGWAPGTELVMDRKDKTKNYGPDNCEFITKTRKANSKSNTVMVTTEDGRTISFRQFYDENCIPNGASYHTAHSRFTQRGWAARDAVIKPPTSVIESNQKRKGCNYL